MCLLLVAGFVLGWVFMFSYVCFCSFCGRWVWAVGYYGAVVLVVVIVVLLLRFASLLVRIIGWVFGLYDCVWFRFCLL